MPRSRIQQRRESCGPERALFGKIYRVTLTSDRPLSFYLDRGSWLVGLRLRHAELVLHRLHAVHPVRHLGRLGAHRNVRHLAAQHHHARVGADVDLLQLRVLAEVRLDGLRDLLVIGLDGLAGRRGHDLEVILHLLDAFNALGDVRRGGLRLFRVDLTAQEDLTVDGLDPHVAALDPIVREEGDLGLGSQPALADGTLHLARGLFDLVRGLVHRRRGLIRLVSGTRRERDREEHGGQKRYSGLELATHRWFSYGSFYRSLAHRGIRFVRPAPVPAMTLPALS